MYVNAKREVFEKRRAFKIMNILETHSELEKWLPASKLPGRAEHCSWLEIV